MEAEMYTRMSQSKLISNLAQLINQRGHYHAKISRNRRDGVAQ